MPLKPSDFADHFRNCTRTKIDFHSEALAEGGNTYTIVNR